MFGIPGMVHRCSADQRLLFYLLKPGIHRPRQLSTAPPLEEIKLDSTTEMKGDPGMHGMAPR